MSARIPSRRLGQSVIAALQPQCSQWTRQRALPTVARRYASDPARSAEDKPVKVNSSEKDLSNPLLEEYLRKQEEENSGDKKDGAGALREGKMSKSNSSLFLPEREIPGWKPDLSVEERQRLEAIVEAQKAEAQRLKEARLTSMNLDPDPKARRRVERKLVLSSLKKHGRLSKAQTIARTERQALFKSQNLPTSVKKLQKVVNQIAGKTVSEALVQLRFSKKKVARDVIKGLEMAQNRAIVGRGMGLGSGPMAKKRWEAQRAQTDIGRVRDIALSKEEREAALAQASERPARSTTIELKDGSKKVVRDPTEIYIDQAWVGKGDMWKSPDFRARGQMNLFKHRTTSFTVLLKEEKTRIRISEEIKKKRDNRKLWTALPDRPITSQRQYCLW